MCQLDSCKEKVRMVKHLLQLPNSCPRHYSSTVLLSLVPSKVGGDCGGGQED
jgi:hypothetical protein